jgi:phosphohistidine phosphatase
MTTRTLLLMRHGKSDWSAGAVDDFSRPLSRRGRRNSRRIGLWISEHGLRPDILIASPAARTLQTATLICKALHLPPEQIVQEEDLYLAGLATLLDIIRQLPASAHTAMLIGHNPGMETLLVNLAGAGIPRPADGKLLPTAALAHMQFASAWQRLGAGQARLVELVRARSLDEK